MPDTPTAALLDPHPRPPRQHARRAGPAGRGHRRGRRQHRGRSRASRPSTRPSTRTSSSTARSEAHQQRGARRRSRGSTASSCSSGRTAPSPCTRAARSRCCRSSPVGDRDDLSMAYTPGVARVCNAIEAEPERVHELTIKKNTVAIVTDGTAVLGLGDIGPEAALPVMEGKALLFKEFAGVDAFPICLDVTERRRDRRDACVRIAPVFGGINLEDIAAPQCFEVEERLQGAARHPRVPRRPARHRRGGAGRAARTRSRSSTRRWPTCNVVIAGVGAAGVAIAKILMEAGVPERHRRRPQGRDLGRPRRPQPGQAVVRREHQPRSRSRARWPRSCRAPTCSSA